MRTMDGVRLRKEAWDKILEQYCNDNYGRSLVERRRLGAECGIQEQ
jgi:hypothetical protein